MIKDGQPNKAISAALSLSTRAVELRRAGLMKKVGARTLAELLRMAFEQDLAHEGR